MANLGELRIYLTHEKMILSNDQGIRMELMCHSTSARPMSVDATANCWTWASVLVAEPLLESGMLKFLSFFRHYSGHQNGGFRRLWTPKCDYSSSRLPKGISLRKSASFKLSSVKIR